jgi:predicted nucleic-acid-binding Zn-ribbon protein
MLTDEELIVFFLAFLHLQHIALGNMLLLDELLQDDSVQVNADHRKLPRTKRRKMDHGRTRMCIEEDYFSPNCHFNGSEFKRMFRVSRTQFEKIACRLAANSSFYTEQTDATGVPGSSVEAKIMIALKTVGFGCSPFAFRDYFQMSQTLARKCFDTFVDLMPFIFEDEYLRFPSKDDVRRILKLHKYEHSVSGMLGSLDVMQVPWKNCPKMLHGQFRGRSGISTVALEAISDYNLYFWHVSFGYPGTLNDINVLNISTLLEKLITCIVLHNMRVEEYVSGRNSKYKPDDGIDVEPLDESFNGFGGNSNDSIDDDEDEIEKNGWMEAHLDEWNKLTNHFEHKRLQDSVVEQLSSLKLY